MTEGGSTDAFFERMYQAAGDDWDRIPWARLAPRPSVVAWLDRVAPAPGSRALVVACGYGDDAEELARRGCVVDAFDVSASAIAAARRRFPGSPVAYRTADLFALPEAWRGRFDVVVEVQTVQSVPIPRHREAIAAIAATVAPGGRLFVRTAVRAEDEPAASIPWPLTPSELAWFEDEGLVLRHEDVDDVFVHRDYER